MEIKEKPLCEVKPYENNPRYNEGAVDAVAESIKQFGFKVPIVIDSDGVIVAGHTRVKAAEKLGLQTVPCIIADDLTPEQVKAFRLADNKTAELAEWDFDKLQAELDGLDIDMSAFGFDLAEFETTDDIVEDEVPEVDEEAEPITKLGDIYQLGEHRLMCGDSTKAEEVAQLMDGAVADLYLTDPPYNVDYEGCTQDKLTIINDKQDDKEFLAFLTDAFTAANGAMKAGAAFYIWHADSEGFNFRAACQENGWKVRECLIWNKNSLVMGRQDYQWKHEPCLYGWKDGAAHYFIDDRTQTTIIDEDKPLRSALHPTMKPIKLFSRLIINSSRKGETVLDSFGGSGTTLIACEQLGRKAYLMELDPKYCDVIVKRWEDLTGQKAVKILRKNDEIKN